MNLAIAAPQPTPAETEWVDTELVRSMMRTARHAQVATSLMIPVYLGVLWGDVDPAALLLWALVALAAAGARTAVLRHFSQEVARLPAPAQLQFFRRTAALWPISGAVWGATVWLYFDRAPLTNQFIGWLVLAGIAMFAVNGLSAQLEAVRAYLNGLLLTALAFVAWRVVVDLELQGPYYHYWMMALLVIFWQVLHQAARGLHLTHRRNFELQFRNNQLIASLTRQTQAALDAVEIKNRFLASATHDIRQPVHALGLYADWLASEPDLVHELAPKIVDATKAVNTLFDSLFDMARLDTGAVRVHVAEVPLDKLLADLELQYRPIAEAKGLTLRVRPARGVAVSDRLLLQRVLGNLVSNAIKYTERGGVLVGVRRSKLGLRVEVWDTGVGIAPAHQREIFREFYKIPIHSGTEDGFGLGLYIVSRLTHILGHPVSLASQPGRGTVFRVLLTPTDPQQAAARAAAASIDQLASRP
jgi:signal transduction histidine kinase